MIVYACQIKAEREGSVSPGCIRAVVLGSSTRTSDLYKSKAQALESTMTSFKTKHVPSPPSARTTAIPHCLERLRVWPALSTGAILTCCESVYCHLYMSLYNDQELLNYFHLPIFKINDAAYCLSYHPHQTDGRSFPLKPYPSDFKSPLFMVKYNPISKNCYLVSTHEHPGLESWVSLCFSYEMRSLALTTLLTTEGRKQTLPFTKS